MERFWSKAKANPETKCWEWQGAKTKHGYGVFRDGKRIWRAHRFSFSLHNPDAEMDGLVVCHKCDNPACVNPEHLSLGTVQDNIKDKVDKGRSNESKELKAGLTEKEAQEILDLQGVFVSSRIAKVYGVPKDTVWAIWEGRIFRNLHKKFIQ